MHYCAVCLIARDENAYIREWAEYHLRIGFDALVVYDNQSLRPLGEELADLAALGRVRLHAAADSPAGWLETQAAAYRNCLERYGSEFKWIAFIDSDEFIFPKQTGNIKELLAEFEGCAALAVNWVQFGTSGLEEPPGRSQIFSFIHRDQRESTTVKCIVQPKKLKTFRGPHGGVPLPGHYTVTSDHFPLEPDPYSAPFAGEVVQINHYLLRSWGEFLKKSERRRRNKRPAIALSREQERERYSVRELELIKFYAPLREAPISWAPPPEPPADVAELTEKGLAFLEKGDFSALELYLCAAALVFEAEPMIWVLRSCSARLRGNPSRAFHCIREASRLSGASTVYYELARVYQALGEEEKSRRAQAQAEFKKEVEEATCAP